MTVTSQNALAFVEQHGVVLEGAAGPVVNLAEAMAGAPLRGRFAWITDPNGRQIELWEPPAGTAGRA